MLMNDEGAPNHKGASENFCCTFTTTAAAAKRGGHRHDTP